MNTYKLSFVMLLFAQLFSAQVFGACNPDITPIKPDRIYIDHGNGAVTDTETGLMWMKCTLGRAGTNCESGTYIRFDWKEALDAAQAANAGSGTFGHTDWRLPNLNELLSLVEHACFNPAINTAIFPNTLSGLYSTSSPVSDADGQDMWRVTFREGFGASYMTKQDRNVYVRLVRNAQ